MENTTTISSHTYQPTNDKNIFRFVDRIGNWTHYWIKNIHTFFPAVNYVIRVGYPKGDRFYSYLLNAHPDEANRKLRNAGEEGARTHDVIRDLIQGEKISMESKYFNEITGRFESLNADEWENVEAFIELCAKYQPEVIVHEHTMWSEKYRFAGTVDFFGTIFIPEGDKSFPKDVWNTRISIVIDWKTSSGIWDDYELQTSAYRQAIIENSKSKETLENEIWTAIVRLGTNHKSGFEMKAWNADQ